VETLDAQAVRRFFRWLKDQGLNDNGPAHLPARTADVVQLPSPAESDRPIAAAILSRDPA
jgi:hypothetical protein